MKKAISLMLIFFLTTGFGWGRSREEKEEPKPTPTPAVSAYRAQERAETPATRPTYTSSYSASARAETAPAVEEAPASVTPAGESVIPTDLTRALASGDKEEVKRKMESLRRLSLALQKMNEAKQGG